MYDLQSQVLSVHDGDFLKLRVDLGFCVHDVTVRLARLNAPELSTVEGKAAHAFADGWIEAHAKPSAGVTTEKDKQRKYGRCLATIYALADATATLLAGGYAGLADLVTRASGIHLAHAGLATAPRRGPESASDVAPTAPAGSESCWRSSSTISQRRFRTRVVIPIATGRCGSRT